MFIIQCPWCGDRDQTEFSCHGEAHIARPKETESLTDEQWGDYVFFRTNPKGMHRERWVHTHGCRRWFNALRDTATDEIFATYKVGEAWPQIPATAIDTSTAANTSSTTGNSKGDQS